MSNVLRFALTHQVLLDLAKERLASVTKDHGRYKSILEGLAAQCLCQLNEAKLVLRCRKADENLVKVIVKRRKIQKLNCPTGRKSSFRYCPSNYNPIPEFNL